METIALKTFNKFAALHDLELIKDEGFFYWSGLTTARIKCHKEYEAIYVYKFSDLSLDQWIEHLKITLNKIETKIESKC